MALTLEHDSTSRLQPQVPEAILRARLEMVRRQHHVDMVKVRVPGPAAGFAGKTVFICAVV